MSVYEDLSGVNIPIGIIYTDSRLSDQARRLCILCHIYVPTYTRGTGSDCKQDVCWFISHLGTVPSLSVTSQSAMLISGIQRALYHNCAKGNRVS